MERVGVEEEIWGEEDGFVAGLWGSCLGEAREAMEREQRDNGRSLLLRRMVKCLGWYRCYHPDIDLDFYYVFADLEVSDGCILVDEAGACVGSCCRSAELWDHRIDHDLSLEGK